MSVIVDAVSAALGINMTPEQADYQLMLELTRQQDDWYTAWSRANSFFLPAAYNKAYWQGRQ